MISPPRRHATDWYLGPMLVALRDVKRWSAVLPLTHHHSASAGGPAEPPQGPGMQEGIAVIDATQAHR